MAEYSPLDRLLHRTALDRPAVAEMIHDIERGLYLKSSPPDSGAHVFITGLARAGTTILMREIYRSGIFGSLTYADMPFVLAPNLWHKLSHKGQDAGVRAERAHGDGIAVDLHSPEALDEVFWRVFAGDAYIRPDRLLRHAPSAGTIAGYRDFIRLVLRRTGTTRYLSKNNNNILRLGALARALPKSVFLIPLRDPLQHARSLLAQHQRFLGSDAFVHSYMTWLGHHEFGSTHRRFGFDGTSGGDPAGLDYWLWLWIAAHTALDATESEQANVVFVSFAALATDPAVWAAVAARTGIAPGTAREIRAIPDRDPGPHDPGLAAAAAALHARLVARALGARS